jgi:rhamnulokinase
MGIDTWGVDFVLLDANGERMGNAVAYRDKRTDGVDKWVYQIVPEQELYRRTGIQKQNFNTIYQLMALQRKRRKELEQAKALLMIPDYFHYLLTGIMASEYTIATTSQLINPETKQWDRELIEALGFDGKIFKEIRQPGSILGELKEEIKEEVGFNCKVVLPAEHDTASAVMAVPICKEESEASILYISSGTWSLLGTELFTADCSEQSRIYNFTNEGGYDYRFRYLKNIMGLWMIQSVKREIGADYSFAEICTMAEGRQITSVVDCDAQRFLSPENMTREIRKACEESGQQVPQDLAETAAVIYHSLALCYAQAAQKLEELTGKQFSQIHIIGGGSNADYLNQLTAQVAGICVLAEPTEATAIGNAIAQMIADGVWEDLAEARECVYRSFSVRRFLP